MKIKPTLLFLFAFTCSVCFGQNSLSFDFAGVFHNKDHYGLMTNLQMTTDSLGNHYVVCLFDGIHDVDPSSNEELIEVLDGENKLFLGKYSSTGQLLWKKTTVLNVSAGITDIHVDQTGNIYLSGWCSDSIDLGFDGTQIIHSTGLAMENTKFLAKYTNNGSLIWYKAFKADSFRFNLNNDDEVISSGKYGGSIDLGLPGNPHVLNGSLYNIFLAKFSSNGNVVWAKSTSYGYPTDLDVCDIGSDANGAIYISGAFKGILDADFDSGSYLLNTSYGINSYYVGIYFCKYTTNGSILWGKMSTGVGGVNRMSFQVNQSGEMLVTGKFAGYRDFDVNATQNTIEGDAADNLFVAKYDNTCNLIYVNKLIAGQQYNTHIWATTLSKNGHSYLLSRKSHTIYTANDTISHPYPAFDLKSDLSRVEFDSLGNVVQEHFFDITPPVNASISIGYAVSLGIDGNPVLLGELGNKVDIDQTSGTLYPPKANTYFLASFLQTGEINWCSFIGTNSDMGQSDETTTGVVFDNQGGYFVTGIYKRQVDLDLTANTFYTDSAGSPSSSYLCYYDPQNERIWSHCFTGNNVLATIVLPPVLDSDNNVLVPMHYSGNLAFNTPANNYTDTLTNQGTRFGLFKFDDDGGLIWAKRIFTKVHGWVFLTDVELSATNEIFVTGTFYDTLFFNLQGVDTMLVSNSGSNDIFVARLNANGELVWIRSIGGAETDQAFQILPDGPNSFYLSGAFSGTVNLSLNGGTNNYTSLHPQATFFAWYSYDGNVGYVKILNSTYYLDINEFKKDHAGSLILAGGFKGMLDCDPSSSSYYFTTNSYNSFIGKYSASGQLTWAKSFENSANEIRSFIVDSLNNILVGGSFGGNIQFSATPAIHRTAITGTKNIFLAYLNGNGQINNVFSFGPIIISENLTHIAYKNGLIGITGNINEIGVDFDPSGTEKTLRSYHYADGFLAKYRICTAPSVSILWNFITMKASVDGVGYQWIDQSTNEAIPGATQQYFTPTEDGSYYVVITTADGCTSSSQNLNIVNLGLQEVQKGQITIYPNPTSSFVTIKTETPSDTYRVSVYSLSGITVLTQNLSGNSLHELDASAWPQGVYLLHLDSVNESQVFKIIKN